MSDNNIPENDLHWLHLNAPLLLLLKNELPPTVKEVIDVKNSHHFDGIGCDSNLLDNLLILSSLFRIKSQEEYSAYPVIAEYLDAEILGEAGQPDLLTKDGFPVEVKVGNFNSAALRQLQGYMKKLGANRGYAFAKRLTIKLPENISFFQICFKEYEYEIVDNGGNENA
ncbi:hypothetical protein SOASR014_37640 [Pectobacterium carotovorum subsp. carotovorum]|nr:hypothetical protein SOASR014_37640 [Pectobacterium carotovorum subsp. carotovorum]GLX46186.1 hypothetical protein Pcaca01_38540 [Pectobacterium carotovorum subsp. carotovorum]